MGGCRAVVKLEGLAAWLAGWVLVLSCMAHWMLTSDQTDT